MNTECAEQLTAKELIMTLFLIQQKTEKVILHPLKCFLALPRGASTPGWETLVQRNQILII